MEKIDKKRLELIETLLNKVVSRLYPVVKHMTVEGPNLTKGYFNKLINLYTIKVYTTIPEGITIDNYWDSEYADMDFSWMGYHHVNEMLTYLSINPDDFIRNILVYNENDELIGEF